MPRTPIQYEQMKDERKLSILESALFLFAQNGYENVPMDSVCQRAKCSHGLVYHYFKNTRQILDELLKSDTYQNVLKSLQNFDNSQEIYSRIEGCVKTFLNLLKTSKTEICFALIILDNKEKKSLYDNLVKLVAAGQKERTIAAGQPSDIVDTFYFFIKGVYLTYLSKRRPNVKAPSLDNIMQIFKR